MEKNISKQTGEDVMNNAMSISVALCTYNGEKYLAKQLESIIAQTMQPDQVVICDDCSKDNSVDLAKAILKDWSGDVKIIRNRYNLGFAKNFQKAISLCSGDIIFLSDQDDVWCKDKIKKLMNVFDTYLDALLAFHDAKVVDNSYKMLLPSFWETRNFDYTKFENNVYEELYKHNVVQGAACAFRRELVGFCVPFCEAAWHDEWLALIATTKGRIVPVAETLLLYRQTGNNAIGVSIKPQSKEKIRRWFIQREQSYYFHYCALLRRYKVLCAVKERADFFPSVGERYKSYLFERIKSIENKTITFPSVLSYCQLEGGFLCGLRMIGKDMLALCFYNKIGKKIK